MLNPPQLLVVVPTRNSAATLEATLLSLASQQRVRLTAIVVDSASSDGTIDICRRWGIPTVSSPPGSMYRAINDGMRAVPASSWLTYLNSDDLAYADGYARLIEHGERGPFDVVYGTGDFVDEHGGFLFSRVPFGHVMARRQLGAGTMPFVQPAAIFRREVYDRLGGFDERLTQNGDYDFFARASSAGFRFRRLRGPAVAAFRVHADQMSRVQRGEVRREQAASRLELGRHRRYERMGLSAAWKVRNAVNYLALAAGRAEARRHAAGKRRDTGTREP